jgi:hypothetical protein
MSTNSTSNKQIVVRGLDYYSKKEIERFWREWSPEDQKIMAIGLSYSKNL